MPSKMPPHRRYMAGSSTIITENLSYRKEDKLAQGRQISASKISCCGRREVATCESWLASRERNGWGDGEDEGLRGQNLMPDHSKHLVPEGFDGGRPGRSLALDVNRQVSPRKTERPQEARNQSQSKHYTGKHFEVAHLCNLHGDWPAFGVLVQSCSLGEGDANESGAAVFKFPRAGTFPPVSAPPRSARNPTLGRCRDLK